MICAAFIIGGFMLLARQQSQFVGFLVILIAILVHIL